LWLTPYFKGLSQINPVLVNFQFVTIYWYGVCLALGIILGLWWLFKNIKDRGLKTHLLDLAVWVILSGVIGARLTFVILKWPDYASNLGAIFNLQAGGMSIHGALIFGSLVIIIYSYFNKLSALKVFDVLAPAVVIGQIVGRFGNFFNQEAFGGPTNLPWKMFVAEKFRPLGLESFSYYHPTFLYAIVGLLIIFIVLLWLRQRKLIPGLVLLSYVIMYSLLRFVTEFFRIDSDYWGSLTVAQWASIVVVSISLITSLILRYRSKTKS